MKINKERALILSLKPLKDANKLAICFSEESGKLSLVVKGASKLTSKRSPSLDGGNVVFISYYVSKGELDLLLEVKLLDDLSNLKSTVLGINCLLYILEVLNRFIQPSLRSKEYFHDLLLLLNYMNSDPSLIYLLLSLFQLKTIKYFGFEPVIDKCAICNERLKENESRILNLDSNIGYICSKHFHKLDKDHLIKDNILKIQRYLLNINIENISIIDISKKDWFNIISIGNIWIQSVIERKINSYDLLIHDQ